MYTKLLALMQAKRASLWIAASYVQDPAYTRHKEICIAPLLAGEHASF